MRFIKIICNSLVFFSLSSLFFAGNIYSKQQHLNVAAASNLTYVMPAIIKAFEKQHSGINVRLSLASTGNLYSQIMNGAPHDIFLAADEKRPDLLYKAGLTIGGPFVYASGSLVLWSSKKLGLEGGINGLSSPAIRRVALANPRHAPYGEAARSVLERAGLWEALQPKLIYGENISQTAQFLLSGSAEAGFVAESMLKSSALQGGTFYLIPGESHEPIMQRGVILKRKKGAYETAILFKDFLFSKKAGDIFIQYGYKVK